MIPVIKFFKSPGWLISDCSSSLRSQRLFYFSFLPSDAFCHTHAHRQPPKHHFFRRSLVAFAPRVARAPVYAVSAHRLRAIQALFHISRTRCLALRLGHSRVTNNKSKKRKSINASHFSTEGEMADSSDDGCNKGPWTEDEDIELSRLQVRETPFFSSSLPTPFHPYSQTHSRAHERTNQQTFTRHATAHVALTRKRVWVAHRRLPPKLPRITHRSDPSLFFCSAFCLVNRHL